MQYTLIRSNRRTLAVQIKPDGTIIVRSPLYTDENKINKFLSEKSRWIEKHLKELRAAEVLPEYTEIEIKGFMRTAKRVLPAKVEYYAKLIGVSYNKITIRKARTVWGSCTVKGNLNFNCLIAALPCEIADYVIIHELCHRKQMNHSRAFWDTVFKYCPDYQIRRKWLKTYGQQYLNRLRDI